MESKTPIADQVRKLEIQRNQVKANLENLNMHVEAAPETDYHLHVISADLPNLVVDKTMFITILHHNIVLAQRELDSLEHKLTTVYAVLEDCLGDSK
ncbi:hypothetical protein [Vibrio phage VpKK5]|uniref:hypothetical protein n=1 Tax=Vibrio phage VpKK5 TaxID=1538804 RepID=UPI0004F68041|nr:hypothetical protein VC55_gp80 [Vibrio phage VpKK5]AIM40583.1 hypothetical protein [Vibrio phage VpKK5]